MYIDWCIWWARNLSSSSKIDENSFTTNVGWRINIICRMSQQSVSFSFVWKTHTFQKSSFLGSTGIFLTPSIFFYIFLKFQKKIFTIVFCINAIGLFFYTKVSPTRFSHKSQSRKLDLRFPQHSFNLYRCRCRHHRLSLLLS